MRNIAVIILACSGIAIFVGSMLAAVLAAFYCARQSNPEELWRERYYPLLQLATVASMVLVVLALVVHG
jgi:uncharacterized membrane protein YidH (DUF202 family)